MLEKKKATNHSSNYTSQGKKKQQIKLNKVKKTVKKKRKKEILK